ncbi:MAG TPA: hypothetical protein VLU46_11575 [Thermoanaerobaculia bacterium]|nr:hypothetical protein [Thermoanaerobaculia bacterium]
MVLAIGRLLILPGRVRFDSTESFAIAVVIPLTATFIYCLAVFTFGLSGDLSARQSMYPARMFTLPLSAGALAGWPMLYGAATMVLLWLTTRLLSVWPAGTDVPAIWPALLAASLLAWTQALTWTSYPMRGLRVVVTVLWLATIDAIVMVALNLKASEGVMLLILAPHVPLAYVVSRAAIARARRGDVPDWRIGGVARAADARDFRSVAGAQVWFEWRHSGRSLPGLVAMVLPFELALLFVFRETPPIVIETVAAVLLTPPFLAVFVAATAGDVSAFAIRRPMTTDSLVSAKLRAALLSTLVTWLFVLIAMPIALQLSGTAPVLLDIARWLASAVGVPRAVAIGSLVIGGLFAATWKQLVQSLFIAMSGREWLIKGSVFGALSLLAVAPPLGNWVFTDRTAKAALWTALPWILAGLVCVKTIAGAWIATRLRLAVVWVTSVAAVYALLVWIFPNVIVRHYILAFVAILVVPLVRVAAAPLALEANRHR